MKRGREQDTSCGLPVSPSHTSLGITCPYEVCKQKNITFSSQNEYEVHFLGRHFHQCSACKRRFPNDGLLQIHIEENHDPFFELKKEQGLKMYRCLEYTAGCKKVCSSRRKRRLHMIDKHGYPKEFDFGVVDRGVEE